VMADHSGSSTRKRKLLPEPDSRLDDFSALG
jgi:hypothetical protein